MSGLLDSAEGPVDVALVQVLREHFTADDSSAPAWFRASGDPHVGAALRAMHAEPARQWTVARSRRRGDAVALGLRPALHRPARGRTARVPDRVAEATGARS